MDIKDLEPKKTVIILGIIILAFALGIGLTFVPPATEQWISTVVLALIMPIVNIKFFALSLLAWHENKRILGLLWGILAVMSLFLTLVAWHSFIKLLSWPRFG